MRIFDKAKVCLHDENGTFYLPDNENFLECSLFHLSSSLKGISCLQMMSDGQILISGTYHELLASSQKFFDLVNAHKETANRETLAEVGTIKRQNYSTLEIQRANVENEYQSLKGDQLIKQEEREIGDTGFKPYFIYLNQNKGYLYFSINALAFVTFLTGQILQNTWIAFGVDNPHVTKSKLIIVYIIIGFCSTFFLLIRAFTVVLLGAKSSESFSSQLLNSLFHASMSFYDSTPLGRILSRVITKLSPALHICLLLLFEHFPHMLRTLQVSSDLNIVDLDIPFNFIGTSGSIIVAYAYLGVLASITWQALFVIIPVIYMALQLQVRF